MLKISKDQFDAIDDEDIIFITLKQNDIFREIIKDISAWIGSFPDVDIKYRVNHGTLGLVARMNSKITKMLITSSNNYYGDSVVLLEPIYYDGDRYGISQYVLGDITTRVILHLKKWMIRVRTGYEMQETLSYASTAPAPDFPLDIVKDENSEDVIKRSKKAPKTSVTAIQESHSMTQDFEIVDDDGEIIAMAKVTDGYIEEMEFGSSKSCSFKDHALHSLLNNIATYANRIGSNLVVDIVNADIDIIRSLERYGFQRTKGNTFKRISGSIISPV